MLVGDDLPLAGLGLRLGPLRIAALAEEERVVVLLPTVEQDNALRSASSASIAGSMTSAMAAPTATLSKLTYASPPEPPVLKRSYSTTLAPASFAWSMIVAPEPVSMLTRRMTPASSAIACSACACCWAGSFSALTMLTRLPPPRRPLRSSAGRRSPSAASWRCRGGAPRCSGRRCHRRHRRRRPPRRSPRRRRRRLRRSRSRPLLGPSPARAGGRAPVDASEIRWPCTKIFSRLSSSLTDPRPCPGALAPQRTDFKSRLGCGSAAGGLRSWNASVSLLPGLGVFRG